MNVKPLRERVLVDIIRTEEKTPGGIILPTSQARKKTQSGYITAIGVVSNENEKNIIKIGAKILFDQFAGTVINIDDKDYLIINNHDILAVVSDDTKCGVVKSEDE